MVIVAAIEDGYFIASFIKMISNRCNVEDF